MTRREYIVPICVLSYPKNLATELIRSFLGDQITIKMPPFSSYNKLVIDNNKVLLRLASGEGIPYYTKKQEFFYMGALGVVYVFSRDNRRSFTKIKNLYQEFREYSQNPDVSVTLIGLSNTSEVISTDEAETLAKEFGANYFEVQIKDKQMLTDIFNGLIRKALKILKEYLG